MVKKTGPEAKLLVVDDEPNIRELLSTSLRFAGFEVIAAANGRDALAAAEEHNPDLAVLDVMLPDMDGFTVTRRLRAAGRHFPVDTDNGGTHLSLGIGGAITADSEDDAEWDEIQAKAHGVLSTLGSNFPS